MYLPEAMELIDKKINEPDINWPDKPQLAVIKDSTIERHWGWVFFYNSKQYLESGNITDALAGNAPFIVNRETGEIIETGTSDPVEHYIELYEKCLERSRFNQCIKKL